MALRICSPHHLARAPAICLALGACFALGIPETLLAQDLGSAGVINELVMHRPNASAPTSQNTRASPATDPFQELLDHAGPQVGETAEPQSFSNLVNSADVPWSRRILGGSISNIVPGNVISPGISNRNETSKYAPGGFSADPEIRAAPRGNGRCISPAVACTKAGGRLGECWKLSTDCE
jgi:hypothetical protein